VVEFLKSLGAVADPGQTQEHVAELPRVSSTFSDILHIDDASKWSFSTERIAKPQLSRVSLFLSGATSPSAANFRSFQISALQAGHM
jgi:hypothetical protein